MTRRGGGPDGNSPGFILTVAYVMVFVAVIANIIHLIVTKT